ncbi:glycosyltransferase family 4 protein [Nocardioides insulae]|uniref:glycosyltransferase family 4 protein n=1 Tax=Nocardioides insulae TaxID=394734 RepID=UPI000422A17E|nr:glycosyltransferase family 1 protein [Nocardioides insulae]
MSSVVRFPRTTPVGTTADRAEPLRVLVVTESFLPQVNGVTNSVRRVLEHLSAAGHVAELVAPTGPATYAGFPVVHARGATLPFYREFRIGLETRGWLRAVMTRFRPDVVHVASPVLLGHQAIRAAGDLGVPSVAIYQTDLVGFAARYGVVGGPQAAAALIRRIHHRCDLTLAPSSASLAQLDRLGVPRTALWPRGVDLLGFHPSRVDHDLRRRLAPDGRLLVGYVGRLAAEKELDLLTGLARDDRYALVLVGEGPEGAALRRRLPGAHFLGTLHGEALGAAYASFDAFVHTGRHETFCQAAQEALASGVPVVAPRAGGPLDLVREGENGFLYTPGDARALGSAVGRLRDDPVLRRRLGLAARRGVAARSWGAVNDRLVQHYREVIAVGRRGERLAA